MRKSRYVGEDTRPTSKKELWGWYAYGVASEVFVICAISSFIPVTLERLARARGVLRSDGTTPCIDAPAAHIRSIGARDENSQCIIKPLGIEINTSSFALYTSSAAIFVQVITLISISALADYGHSRKRLLLALGFTGGIACSLLALIGAGIYLIAPVLVIISEACLGASYSLLNAFLPVFAANHPDASHSVSARDDLYNPMSVALTPIVPENTEERDGEEDASGTRVEASGETVSQAPRSDAKQPPSSSDLQISTTISAKGAGLGYAAALTIQFLSIIFLITISKTSPSFSRTTIPLRLILFLIGLWWTLFTIPSALYLRPRPGPPLPLQSKPNSFSTYLSSILFSWRSTFQTLRLSLSLPQLLKFLLAWFFLSDAVSTISDTALLFAKTELHMSDASVAAIALIATFSGILGAILWPLIQSSFHLQPRTIIIMCVFLFALIPLDGLLYFLPPVQHLGFLGIQSPIEIFMQAFIHGFAMGGVSAYCRAFFGAMVPRGREAAFFALYAATDKGSSVVGPFVVGRIADGTGSLRGAFWWIGVLILVPAPLVWWVDVERGRRDAEKYEAGRQEVGEDEGDEAEGLLEGRE